VLFGIVLCCCWPCFGAVFVGLCWGCSLHSFWRCFWLLGAVSGIVLCFLWGSLWPSCGAVSVLLLVLSVGLFWCCFWPSFGAVCGLVLVLFYLVCFWHCVGAILGFFWCCLWASFGKVLVGVFLCCFWHCFGAMPCIVLRCFWHCVGAFSGIALVLYLGLFWGCLWASFGAVSGRVLVMFSLVCVVLCLGPSPTAKQIPLATHGRACPSALSSKRI